MARMPRAKVKLSMGWLRELSALPDDAWREGAVPGRRKGCRGADPMPNFVRFKGPTLYCIGNIELIF